MPGGDPAAWPHVEAMLKGIAARAPDGTPTVDWVGEGGAGHFVKMVHNGIEYGDMQVIAEAYDLMRRGLGLTAQEIGDVFEEWNQGRLKSYLIEITADILRTTENGEPLIDKILDAAGQKGTGKWTVMASMDLAEPTALVAEAVYARIVSSDPDRRARTAEIFASPTTHLEDVRVEDVEAALYASKIISYAQGFRLLDAASTEYGWDLDLGSVASLWRAGCIIRAAFLEDIMGAYLSTPDLPDLTEEPSSPTPCARLRNRGEQWSETPSDRESRFLPIRVPGLLRRDAVETSSRRPDPGATRPLWSPHLRKDRPSQRCSSSTTTGVH